MSFKEMINNLACCGNCRKKLECPSDFPSAYCQYWEFDCLNQKDRIRFADSFIKEVEEKWKLKT